jgi:3D (Asp-Asp-Asp) domain-containing protein
MKWSSRKPTRLDYSQIAIVLLVAALVTLFIMLLTLLAPRQAAAGDIVNFRSARRLAAVALPLDKVTTRASKPVKILYMEISAYSPTVAECDASPLVTASGKRVYVGGIAADLRVLPFGSIVSIPNYNNGDPCTVIDTGSAIKGLKLDVFLWSAREAVHWGRRRNVRVEVLYIPKVTP